MPEGSANPLQIQPESTALVLIDLQEGIASRPVQPRSGAAVVEMAVRLLSKFREAHAPVVLVHVGYQPDRKDALRPLADNPSPLPPPDAPRSWMNLVAELKKQPEDIEILKRQWGAFHGTELDLQLRRRGVNTIVLGGIATNMGVESTARAAFEHGYAQIFVEDAMASFSADAHRFAIENIFPRMGRVRSAAQVLEAFPR